MLPVIHLLNEDVLTYVFYLNTNTPDTECGFLGVTGKNISALDIARHTSQVCQSWRHLILRLPIIWGNIIDLEVLNQASDEWAEEVMKRTGTVNLSIYGPVGSNPRSCSLIVSLLDVHWHRVRRFNVRIQKADLLDKRFWDLFWKRQAPNLEMLVVTGFNPPDIIPQNPDKPDAEIRDQPRLFAGASAPSLRHIHCLPYFTFDHSATWLSQLLSLTLSSPLKTVDTLKVIAHCPRLESLDIQSTHTKTWTRNVLLPNLHRIAISSNVAGCFAYLSNIIPSSDCALILTIEETLFNLRDTNMLQCLLSMVLPYAKKHFDIHSPTDLAINIEELSVRIASKASPVYLGHPNFSMILRSAGQYEFFDTALVDLILSTLSSINLDPVSNLRFALSHPSWSARGETSVQLFRSLTSVKKMTLTPWAMQGLNNIPDSGSLFPRLAKVAIQHHNREQHFNFEKRLFAFLSRRQEAGNPIQVLDLFGGQLGNNFLDGIQGMNLVYEPSELLQETDCFCRQEGLIKERSIMLK